MDTMESATSLDKPKVPLNGYNLFFQLWRARILAGTDQRPLDLNTIPRELDHIIFKHNAKRGKRIHRKTHGIIGFKELAQRVANQWKKADPKLKSMLEERAGIEHDVYRHQMKIWRISQETKNCEPMTRFPELQPLVPQQENGGEIRFPGLSRSPAAVVPLQLRVLLLQRRRIELALSEINKPQRSSPEPPQPATDDPRHFDPVDPQQFISRPFISEETFTMDIFDEVEQQDAAFSSNATPQAHHDETLASTFERSSSSASNVLGFFESDLVQNRYNMFD